MKPVQREVYGLPKMKVAAVPGKNGPQTKLYLDPSYWGGGKSR